VGDEPVELMFDMKDVARAAVRWWGEARDEGGRMEPGPVAMLRAVEILVDEQCYQTAVQMVFLYLIACNGEKGELRRATETLAQFKSPNEFLASYLRERAVGPESN
jgi:hypothetical protein